MNPPARRSRRKQPPRRAGSPPRDEESRRDALERSRQARRRAALERSRFDPSPPGDDDWLLPDEEGDGIHRLPPPVPVGSAVQELLAGRGWDERLHAATLWHRWEEVVGPALAAHCQPVRLAGGTLVLRAESQVWATQLRYLTPQVLSRVGALLGADAAHQVRIVVGRLEA